MHDREYRKMYADAIGKTTAVVRNKKYSQFAANSTLSGERVILLRSIPCEDWEYALYKASDPVVLLHLANKCYEGLAVEEWVRNECESASGLVALAYEWFDLLTDCLAILNVREVVR